MNSTKDVVTSYTLVLTAEESDWLRGIMQNPLCDEGCTEPAYDNIMRGKFWTALNG